MENQSLAPGEVILPNGEVERREVVSEVRLHSLIRTLKGVVQFIAGFCILGGALLALYWFGYFLARGVEWKRPPQVQIYEKYNYYRMYEDGSYSAEYRDGTKVSGCITGALCND